MLGTLHGKLLLTRLALLVPVGIFCVWLTVATSEWVGLRWQFIRINTKRQHDSASEAKSRFVDDR